MNLSESRAIKGPQWLSNMILRADDINFTTEAFYGNLTDQLALRANLQDGDADTVLTGLVLEADTLLTCTLKHGAAVSQKGYYLAGGVWGWTPSLGDIFSVLVAEDTQIGFDAADPSDPRVDILEIRPAEASYNSRSRQFKDPVTEVITSQPTNTKREYGFEFQRGKGTPTALETFTVTPAADTTGSLHGKYLEVSPAGSTDRIGVLLRTAVTTWDYDWDDGAVGSSNWQAGDNWNPNIVGGPNTANDRVRVTTFATQTVYISLIASTTVTIGEFQLETGEWGGKWEINDSLNLSFSNAAQLDVVDSGNGTGSVYIGPGDAVNMGSISTSPGNNTSTLNVDGDLIVDGAIRFNTETYTGATVGFTGGGKVQKLYMPNRFGDPPDMTVSSGSRVVMYSDFDVADLTNNGTIYTNGFTLTVSGTTSGTGAVESGLPYDAEIEVAYTIGATADAIGTLLDTAIDKVAGLTAAYLSPTLTCTYDRLGNQTDAADVNTGFTVTVTQQGAAPTMASTTAGWIKLAEVTVNAGATTLTDADIVNFTQSDQWYSEAGNTVEGRGFAGKTFSVAATDDDTDFAAKLRTLPYNLEGETVTFNFATGTHSWNDLPPLNFTNGKIVISGSTTTLDLTDGIVPIPIWEFTLAGIELSFEGIDLKDVPLNVTFTEGGTFSASSVDLDVNGRAITGMTITGASKVEFTSCTILDDTGSGAWVDAVRLVDCPNVKNLPDLSSTVSDRPEYHARLENTTIGDSSGIAGAKTGKVNPLSSGWVFRDKEDLARTERTRVRLYNARVNRHRGANITGPNTPSYIVYHPNGYAKAIDGYPKSGSFISTHQVASTGVQVHAIRGERYPNGDIGTSFLVTTLTNGGSNHRFIHNDDGSILIVAVSISSALRVHRSTDGGKTWALEAQVIQASDTAFSAGWVGGSFYIMTTFGRFFTSPDGQTWSLTKDFSYLGIGGARTSLISNKTGDGADFVLINYNDTTGNTIGNDIYDGTTLTVTTSVSTVVNPAGGSGAVRLKDKVYLLGGVPLRGDTIGGWVYVLNETTNVWTYYGNHYLVNTAPATLGVTSNNDWATLGGYFFRSVETDFQEHTNNSFYLPDFVGGGGQSLGGLFEYLGGPDKYARVQDVWDEYY